jgi:hypothetical protein
MKTVPQGALKIGDVHFTLATVEGSDQTGEKKLGQGHPVICLVDLGTGLSITNGVEVVIAELHKWFGDDLDAYRVIYRDTMANWDGIAHRGGRFVHFIPLGGLTDRNRAIEAARGATTW